MQRDEVARIKLKRRPHPRRDMLIGLTLYLSFWLVYCGGCAFLVTNFLSGPDWPEDFCTLEDDLYQALAASGDKWAEELAHQLSGSQFKQPQMNVETEVGKLWLYGEGEIGFFVRVVYAPRFTLGKAGYFYSRTDELPTLGPEDELNHLSGNIYCYIFDDPG